MFERKFNRLTESEMRKMIKLGKNNEKKQRRKTDNCLFLDYSLYILNRGLEYNGLIERERVSNRPLSMQRIKDKEI